MLIEKIFFRKIVSKYIVLLVMFFISCGLYGDTVKKNEHNKEPKPVEIEEQQCVIDIESQKLIGLKFAEVTYHNIEETLDVVGEIARDTQRTYHIIPNVSGKVVEIKVNIGDIIKRGQILAVVHLNNSNSNLDINSEWDGIVIGKNISESVFVDEMTSLFTIADISKIEANFDIREKDIAKIKIGQKIKVKSIAYSNKIFTGKIIFISPSVDDITRTIKIRAEIENNEYLLKFNMFVTGSIIIEQGNYLTIPLSALQKLNEKEIVFIPIDKKRFVAKGVKTGIQYNNSVQIISGLKKGQKVVSKGSFLIKSELLKSKIGAGCAE